MSKELQAGVMPSVPDSTDNGGPVRPAMPPISSPETAPGASASGGLSGAVTFVIPGRPFGKQRPRFSRRSGRAFTPAATVSFGRQVAAIAAQHFPEPFAGPVKLTIAASFEPPKSWSKKKTAAHMGRSHMQRPDLDNIAKGVSDALNRIAYADDCQIAACELVKVWGPVARTVITVKELSE